MAKGLREIKNRIRSVTNTGQITRAMQLVASSKMKRAQDAALAGRPYEELLSRILATALRGLNAGDEALSEHPLFAVREIKTRGILVVATDKGLCGALNSNLFRYLNKNIAAGTPARFYTIGKKATQFVARTSKKFTRSETLKSAIKFRPVRATNCVAFLPMV